MSDKNEQTEQTEQTELINLSKKNTPEDIIKKEKLEIQKKGINMLCHLQKSLRKKLQTEQFMEKFINHYLTNGDIAYTHLKKNNLRELLYQVDNYVYRYRDALINLERIHTKPVDSLEETNLLKKLYQRDILEIEEINLKLEMSMLFGQGIQIIYDHIANKKQ